MLFVLTDDSSVCINAAQEEPHFVDTCIQRSFEKKWKECNTTETSTSSYDIYKVCIVRLVFILRRMIYETEDTS